MPAHAHLFDQIQGHDQGQPQRFARVTLTIYILDSNNKSPYFQPSTLRTQIYEGKYWYLQTNGAESDGETALTGK